MTTKTKQDFPTTEEVREAYERTGLKPGAVYLNKNDDGEYCGCGLHALYLDSIGVRDGISDEDVRMARDMYFVFVDNAYAWMGDKGLPLSWATGFDDGVQGRKRPVSDEYPARKAGYETGLAIRKELLNV